MKLFTIRILCISSLFYIFPAASQDFVPNKIWIKFKEKKELKNIDYSTSNFFKNQRLEPLESVFLQYKVKSAKRSFKLISKELEKINVVTLADSNSINSFIESLKKLPEIAYAERIPIYRTSLVPNDIHPNQWNLTKIQAPEAWDFSTGSIQIKVAVVDDAIRIDHEDLSGNIWTNPNEIPNNGIDDDNNGYVDDVNGYDVANDDNNPSPPFYATNSVFTHGTHCAGIVAASSNNGLGIASIGFNVKIIPVKSTLDVVSNGSLTHTYQGVEYAIAAGAHVISMSWGSSQYSFVFQDLFNYAASKGIILVAAAGNNNSSSNFYPAAYSNVISVGSTDNTDSKSDFSNYGTTIDIMAPGSSIWSTLAGSKSGYGYLSGTSMACPLVAGACALLLSKQPTFTSAAVENCLKQGADNINTQNPAYIGLMGVGRLNVYNSIRCISTGIIAKFSTSKTSVCTGMAVSLTDLSLGSVTGWNWTFAGANITTSNARNPIINYPNSGVYAITLRAKNSINSDQITKTNYITVVNPTAQLSGSSTINQAQSAILKVDFVGQSPFSFGLYNGTTATTYGNIFANPYYVSVSPTATSTYSLSSFADNNCSGNSSGSALITVNTIAGVTLPGNNCAPTSGLVAYYPFDGNSNDESGNNNNGILNGGSFVADRNGVPNSALKLNGFSDFMQIPNAASLNPTNAMSFSVWIKPNGFYTGSFFSRYNQLFTSGYGNDASYQVRYSSPDNHGGQTPVFNYANIFTDATSSGLASANAVSIGSNYHLVAIFNGNEQRLYINGIQISSVALGSNKIIKNSIYPNFYLGKNNDSNYPYFVNGIIDEVRL